MNEDMFLLDLLSGGGGVHCGDSDACDSVSSPCGDSWQPTGAPAASCDDLSGFSLNMWDFAIMQSSFGDLQSYDSKTLIGMYGVDARTADEPNSLAAAVAAAALMRRRSDSGYSTSTRSPSGSSSCGSGSPPPHQQASQPPPPPRKSRDELDLIDIDTGIDCGEARRRGGGGVCGAVRSKSRVEKIRKSRNRQLQLWEFLYQLLHETECEALAWESRPEGTFRIAQPSGLAEAWGRHRNRSNMTYEKMSRTLRYYYEKQIITKVTGKQHTYKFHYDRFPL